MQRFIAMAVFVLAFALPSTALAATQTLTVEKAGSGTGTVTSKPAGINCGSTCSAPFTEGDTVVLTGVAGANTAEVEWSGCGKVNLERECSVTMSAAKSVTATFNLQKRPLTVIKNGAGTGTVTSSPAGINCGSTCSASFTKGTAVTLSGAPGPNTLAPSWSGCDSEPEGKCLVTMSAARKVTANFNLVNRQLTISKIGSGTGTVTSSPAGIDCGSTCSAPFTDGTAVTLSSVKGLHSEDVKWSGCDNVTLDNKCLVSMNAGRTVTAAFYLEPQYVEYTVSVQKKGSGQGTVTSVPGGIECGEDCSEKYVNKTRLTLIATPEPGSVFDHWSGGSCAGTGPCEKTINSSRLVKAVFVAVGKRTLTVSRAGNGSGTVSSNGAIACGATCSAEIEASSKITLTAEPAAGSVFAGWSGACSGTAPKCKLLMNEARNVTATFAREASTPTPGTLSVASPVKVKGGKALLRVSCHFGPCRGTLKLSARIKNAQGRAKRVALGRVPVDLQAGASAILKVSLSQRALASLRETGRLRVSVSGGGTDPHSLRLSR